MKHYTGRGANTQSTNVNFKYVCVFCGSTDRNFKHDHLREVYKISQDKLDNHQFCPRLTQDEMDSLQRGTSPVCSNRKLCRKRQLENIKKKMETETVKTVEGPFTITDITETIVRAKNGTVIFDAANYELEYHEAQRLARLIAAAPDLLQCLKNCLAVKPHKVSVEAMKDMIRAALEKATK